MSKTAVATLQTAWDCKWSQPGYRLTRVAERHQPESLWVCVRTGGRIAINESDCETCPYWETGETPGTATLAGRGASKTDHECVAALTPTRTSTTLIGKAMEAALRVIMVATGAWVAFIGFGLLTRPLAIPFAVGTWFVALAIIALAIWGRLPADPPDAARV